MSTVLNRIGQVNSVTYQDLVGLLSGINRYLGESSSAFKERLELNATNHKSHTYVGTLENINTRLGLTLFPAIEIAGTSVLRESGGGAGNFTVSYDFGVITITAQSTYSINTVNITPDGFWDWIMLSTITANINALPGFTATLLCPDGPSLQLAKQQNTGWIINEPVTSQVYQLDKASLYVSGTVIFSDPTVVYTMSGGTVTLTLPPNNLSVSYQYQQVPYTLVASGASIFSLTDPVIQNYVIYNNDLIYQVKEAIQTLMNADGSYWGP